MYANYKFKQIHKILTNNFTFVVKITQMTFKFRELEMFTNDLCYKVSILHNLKISELLLV